MFAVHLAKENFKFSCSHFTILSSNKAEHLHGHNYQVAVDIELSEINTDLGFAFDFNDVKPVIRRLCDSLDERILLAGKSKYLNIMTAGSQVEVKFGERTYSLPEGDVITLPICNISSEELARWFARGLAEDIQSIQHWRRIRVSIEETRGQSVSYTLDR